MTVVLTVDERAWHSHMDRVTSVVGADALIPVVKGNGYGFGRPWLARHAVAAGATTIAVGTVHELPQATGLGATVLVLTPAIGIDLDDLPDEAVLSVGSAAHARELSARGHRVPVVVKLVSSMRRYGLDADELDVVRDLDVLSYSIHPPLAGSDVDHVAEIEAWLPRLPPDATLDVSHIGIEAFTTLRDRHPDRRLRVRLGTSLWHGDKSMLALSADVVDVRPIDEGTPAGYRATPAPATGHLVLIGAGSVHGIALLDGGRSPFHHCRRRLSLLEPPHMHTSMAFVPAGEPLPAPGEVVDVQWPLIMTIPDRIVWVR
ncbi:MAG: alanine racemase [Acidimicrobiia bacterium]